ncbi:MAG TPA: hypothetical protein VK530_06220 [Candidatus Acidoferrum sp.]|nr:hypothetical protein [Candidatus Acidoferrum sp.]
MMCSRFRRFLQAGDNTVRGFSRIELLAVLTGCAVLMAIILPALGSDSIRTQRALCANNLSRIGQAFASWAADHDGRYAWEVPKSAGGNQNFCLVSTQFVVLSNELVSPQVLVCPSDGLKSAANNWPSFFSSGEQNVSYLLTRTSQLEGRAILSGDRNLTADTTGGCGFRERSIFRPATNASWDLQIHVQRGHFLFNDGSVEGTDTPRLRAILSPPGVSNAFIFIAP